MKNHILIIGGMGPQASLKLHQLLLAQANHNAADSYPLIVDASLPIDDFIADKRREARAITQINQALGALGGRQAKVVAIPCNTAHLLLNQLDLADTNFVSIVDCVVDRIVAGKFKRVGILASPNSIRSQLYSRRLIELGIGFVNPTQSQQLDLESIIRGVIGQEDSRQLNQELNDIISAFARNDIDCLVIGCTELSTLEVKTKLPVIDSLAQLAESVMSKYQESRL